MSKLAALLLLFNVAASQQITLPCNFLVNFYGEYICRLDNIEVLNPSADVVFGGSHIGWRRDEDVEVVQIRNSTTPFMIPQIYTTFPNINELEYDLSGLESINMPVPTMINYLTLTRNNIHRIEDNTFANQPQLISVRMSSSNIHEIGEDAFVGLTRLANLGLYNNRITEIAPRTFSPLVSVSTLDLERNNLTRVDEIFTNTLHLSALYLEYNQIELVSPNFVSHLRNYRLGFVNFLGNQCAQKFFSLTDEAGWSDMDNDLNGCYRNFVGSDDISVECRFFENIFEEYCCELQGIEVLDDFANVIFTGVHLEGRTNGDVQVVRVRDSNTPFIIRDVFAAFPNIIELDYQSARLEAVNLPVSSSIEFLFLDRNNIQRIGGSTFARQPQLRRLTMSNNVIQELTENAFAGLTRLEELVLIDNRIREIQPRTFNPLVSVTYIDLEANNLTRIGEVFSANVNLNSLYLEFNQLEGISPNFARHLRDESLTFVNLNGNICADRSFSVGSLDSWMIMNNALQPCFRNFNNETETSLRNLGVQVVGGLKIFDAHGNIIGEL